MKKPRPRPREKDSQGKEIERRSMKRIPPESTPSLKSARLMAGPEVRLINISKRGALLESDTRMTPGANICIRLVAADEVILLHGSVLRSRVLRLRAQQLTYECAIAFDAECSLFADLEKISRTGEDENVSLSLDAVAEAGSQDWVVASGEDPTNPITVTVSMVDSGCNPGPMISRPRT